jgi:hypothetical protein
MPSNVVDRKTMKNTSGNCTGLAVADTAIHLCRFFFFWKLIFADFLLLRITYLQAWMFFPSGLTPFHHLHLILIENALFTTTAANKGR